VLSDRGFFGPSQYEGFVLYLVVGFLLLALVAAWYLFVVRFARSRFPRPQVAGVARVDLRVVRAKYEALIDEVEAESRAHRLSERAVHARLSLLLRFFVFEASGVDAHVMTLADLRSERLPAVTSAVEQYYPPAFQKEQPGDPSAAARTAREVVHSWS
jgi:hypothetical protein